MYSEILSFFYYIQETYHLGNCKAATIENLLDLNMHYEYNLLSKRIVSQRRMCK